MSPLWLTVSFGLALGGFIALSFRKLSLVAKLQPENRFKQVASRMKEVLSLGIFQTRMVKLDVKPGMMHAIFFVGFSTLLIRKIQLLIIGYDAHFTYPEFFGGPYSAFKDFIELCVTAGVVYGFYRRFFNRPKRLEPNWEAILVLSLIFTIMVTDFLYDGFKFALYSDSVPALAHERNWAFFGDLVASWLSGISPSGLTFGYHFFYWFQILTVFSFLVWLPVGEHFHIVTSLPMVFFRRETPLNRVPSVDLESLMADDSDLDEEPSVGAATAMDLTWKDGLDAFTCTECGRCKDSCPTFLTDKPLCMKWVHDDVKHHLMDVRPTIMAGNPDESLPPLVGDVIGEDTLWACTTCGYCEEACPIALEHLGKFYRMRQYKVMMDGEFPAELQDVFSNYERQGNPWGINSGTRGDWAKDLDVPVLESPEQAKELDYLFFVGSAQSFDTRNQKTAKAMVKILKTAGVKFAILGADEGSTGECVRRAGNEMLFQELAAVLVETLNSMGVTRIVTCDPHVFNTLKNEYGEFGGHFEVIHHSELIDQLLKDGSIRVKPSFDRVIYHEPCYLGRHNKIYEAPRRVLKAVTSDRLMEFDMRREKALCCGAGGGRMWMEENIGSRINELRVSQALERDEPPKVIATACPYCTIMLTDGVAHFNKDEEIATRDLAELVADALA